MPTIKVTTYPKCESLVAYRDKWAEKVLARQRLRYEKCNGDGAAYLMVGDLGTVEQVLCVAHKRKAQEEHPEWLFRELKGKGVKVEMKVVAEKVVTESVQVADEDIPFYKGKVMVKDEQASNIASAITALLVSIRANSDAEYQRGYEAGLERVVRLIEPEAAHSAYAAELWAAIRALPKQAIA